jgi:hypothetical protein
MPRRHTGPWSAPGEILVIVLLVCLVPALVQAESAPLWGDLQPGPYAVGYRTWERYDRARTFQAKRDYFGNVLEGERARPVQVCIWYPAKPPAGTPVVVMSDYAFSPPENMDFYGVLSRVQNREIRFLHGLLMNDQSAVLEVLSTDMAARRDVVAAGGRHPVLLYHADVNSGIDQNAVLCEYLASLGFVVAATHSLGAKAVEAQPTSADLESMTGDLAFVAAEVRSLDFTDPDRMGVLGCGTGAIPALLLGLRNTNVDALALLDAPMVDPQALDVVKGDAFFDPVNLTVPVLSIHRSAEEGSAGSILDDMEYAPVYSLGIQDIGAMGLSTYALIHPLLMSAGDEDGDRRVEDYARCCECVGLFFTGHLKDAAGDPGRLEDPVSGLGFDPSSTVFSYRAAVQRPPTSDEFMAMLAEGMVDTALAIYRDLREEDPGIVLFDEAAMNAMGYRYLQRGQAGEAVEIFRINAETYPASANCWDSLTEAYMAVGDTEHALECVERVLETLPGDTRAGPDLKANLRANAERYKEMLESGATENAE